MKEQGTAFKLVYDEVYDGKKGIRYQLDEAGLFPYKKQSLQEFKDMLDQLTQSKAPTESFRFDILDLSKKEIIKYPKKKLIWKKENL